MRWCDLTCPEASFPKDPAVDGAGSCRTFAALYCAQAETPGGQERALRGRGHGPRQTG